MNGASRKTGVFVANKALDFDFLLAQEFFEDMLYRTEGADLTPGEFERG